MIQVAHHRTSASIAFETSDANAVIRGMASVGASSVLFSNGWWRYGHSKSLAHDATV